MYSNIAFYLIIKIVRNNGVWLQVKYEVRKPVMGNLDVIASFDERVMLSN